MFHLALFRLRFFALLKFEKNEVGHQMLRLIFVVLSLALFTQALNDTAIANLVKLYEVSQNTMNVTLVQSVFDKDASLNIPISGGTQKGAVGAFFSNFFSNFNSIKEYLLSPIIVNGHVGAIHKEFVGVLKVNLCVIQVDVIQWFTWNPSSQLFSDVSAVWNLTAFNIQANCK